MKQIKQTVAAVAAIVISVTGLHAGTDMKDSKEVVQQSDCEKMGHFFLGVQGGADFSNAIHTNAGADISSETLALGGLRGGYIWGTVPYASSIIKSDWVNNLTLRTELEADWSGDHRSLGGLGFDYNSAIVLFDNTVGYKLGRFEPYAGGAVGFINTWVHGNGVNDSDISLAYGPIAGVRYHINCHWQAFAEYKFLWSDDKSYSPIDTHSGHDQLATAGVTYVF
jgi:opacity protein-like surface antigen